MNIPTAEELLANNIDGLKELINCDDLYYFYRGVICEFAKGFAELHVREALKQASEKDTVTIEKSSDGYYTVVDIDSILNAYPIENIK